MQSLGVKNVQLPLFIKYSEFAKETKHVDGFAPETFIVNRVGNEEMEDPYIVRPTSEISFCNYFKKIVTSYSQLPILLNQ
jgi:prolyl-tRNA synthetase